MHKFTLMLLASTLFAQAPPSPAIGARPQMRGVILEPGTNAPVAEAEVTVDYHGPTQPMFMPSPPKSTVTIKTDDNGKFSCQPDDYGFFNVHVKKEGYTAGGQTSGMSPTNETFTLTADAPLRELQFFLSRPATVIGRVVDEATDKPIANLRLIAARAANFAGRRMLMGSAGTTDAQGRFRVSSQPGDYVVEVRPQVTGVDRVRTTFTDADLETIDRDYEHTYWPGGHDQQAALPVTAASGSTLDVGLLSVRKIPYYRVHAHVPAASCEPGDQVAVREYTAGYQGDQSTIDLASKIPCGTDLLITGFAPGAYRLLLNTNKPAAGRRMASVPFVVTNQNVEITAALEAGVTLDGKFVLEAGAQPPNFTTFHAPTMHPLGGVPFADVMMPDKVAADGTFHVVGMPAVDHRIDIHLRGGAFYVKEVRYNGSVVGDGIIPMERPSMTHSLTVLLDDKPAIVAGTVTDGDKPVNTAYVIAARWPLAANQIFIASASSLTDDQGRFQISGLAPGEYRFVALRHRDDDRDRAPGKLERALAAAPKVNLSAATVQNIALVPVDVR